mmetsp:Transcript_11759/g.32188  ORF Transcript_11759/g.32188 Transcript_11759/m.32188 type:complete len:210 (+) Transcript_11759:1245-1874(+)
MPAWMTTLPGSTIPSTPRTSSLRSACRAGTSTRRIGGSRASSTSTCRTHTPERSSTRGSMSIRGPWAPSPWRPKSNGSWPSSRQKRAVIALHNGTGKVPRCGGRAIARTRSRMVAASMAAAAAAEGVLLVLEARGVPFARGGGRSRGRGALRGSSGLPGGPGRLWCCHQRGRAWQTVGAGGGPRPPSSRNHRAARSQDLQPPLDSIVDA